MFDTTFHDPNDISLLSCRCMGINNQTNTTPHVVINNDFKDLAAILQNNNSSAAPTAANPCPPQQNSNAPHVIHAALVLKMRLSNFCDRFDLSIFILEKLDALKVTGPHALRFVSDTQLVEKGGLDIGELVDVRDAQEHWTLGKGQDLD
jgi:hypothetical protein